MAAAALDDGGSIAFLVLGVRAAIAEVRLLLLPRCFPPDT